MPIDFLVLTFLVISKNITDETIIQYSFIFGIFYDFLFNTSVGVGVLLFLFLSILKIRSDILFDANKSISKFFIDIFIIVVFVIFNLQHFGYSGVTFYSQAIYCVFINVLFYLVIKLFLEFNSAFSLSK